MPNLSIFKFVTPWKQWRWHCRWRSWWFNDDECLLCVMQFCQVLFPYRYSNNNNGRKMSPSRHHTRNSATFFSATAYFNVQLILAMTLTISPFTTIITTTSAAPFPPSSSHISSPSSLPSKHWTSMEHFWRLHWHISQSLLFDIKLAGFSQSLSGFGIVDSSSSPNLLSIQHPANSGHLLDLQAMP